MPLSVTRTYVKYVDVGGFPQARRAYQVTRCNQCETAPCVSRVSHAAMFKRPDGIVDFDKSICIGCKACMAACPYDAIFINPDDHAAEKCNFCAHRIDLGTEPACVVVCPTEAIVVGRSARPAVQGARQIVQRDAGDGPPAGEGDASAALLQGRPGGDARSAGGPAARRRAVSCGASRGAAAAVRRLRQPGPGQQLGGRAALLRRLRTDPRGTGG